MQNIKTSDLVQYVTGLSKQRGLWCSLSLRERIVNKRKKWCREGESTTLYKCTGSMAMNVIGSRTSSSISVDFHGEGGRGEGLAC